MNEIEQEINEEIRGEVSDRSIHFDGKQILELYRSDLTVENVRNYIPPEVDEIINDAIQNGITKLGIALHLEKNELEQLSTVIPELIEFPINLKPEGISLLEKRFNPVWGHITSLRCKESLSNYKNHMNTYFI